ncbi:MAG: iron export ABC transporter permease subunit FetB [Myxococcota bacterium]
MNGPLPITPFALVGAAALIAINAALSIWLRLDLERRLLIATLRTTVQLSILGYVLVPIFRWQEPTHVVALCLVMVALAAREAIHRGTRTYRGIGFNAFFSLLVAAGITAVLGSAVFVGVEPWWQPRYLLPLLGMILGNGLTGISLGLDRCLAVLDEGRDRVEALLALGASWWEAARPTVAESLRAGMIPILNSMSVVGLVAIPGMMTGQLLGGTSPELAARYQILIMFLIAAATATGAALAILLTVRAIFDDQHRLRIERVHSRR